MANNGIPEDQVQQQDLGEACDCGGKLREIDSNQRSSTVQCDGCENVFLMVGREGIAGRKMILLRDFGDRGQTVLGRPSYDPDSSRELKAALRLGQSPSKNLAIDYGIQSKEQLLAFRRSDATEYELDRVVGDGPAITVLIRHTSPERFALSHFHTPYDYELSPLDDVGVGLDPKTDLTHFCERQEVNALTYLQSNQLRNTQEWSQMADNEKAEEAKQEREESCGCGGKLKEIDSFKESSTVRCDGCDEVYLMVGRDGETERKQILLRDWDERRGGDWGRRLDDIEAAEKLRSSVTWDQPLSPMLSTDFGVTSDHHYLAIRQSDATAYELDRALGDGQAITELVRQTTDERFQNIHFETPYDCFYAAATETQRAQASQSADRGGPDAIEREASDHKESLAATNQEKDRGRDR